MIKLEIAARQALEALEMIATYSEEDKQCDNGYGAAWVANTAIAALRSALEQLNCQCGDKCFPIFSGDIEYCETCGKQTALAEQTERVTEGNGSEVSLETEAQEPVAWALTSENGEVLDCISHTYKVTQPCTVDYDEPLYAAPVRTKDLTDDEIDRIWLKMPEKDEFEDVHWFARAVIAADKEKNK